MLYGTEIMSNFSAKLIVANTSFELTFKLSLNS